VGRVVGSPSLHGLSLLFNLRGSVVTPG
jgi:hypothetical protein